MKNLSTAFFAFGALATGLFLASCTPPNVAAPQIGIDPVVSFQAVSMDKKIEISFYGNYDIPNFRGFDIFASSLSNLLSASNKSGPSNQAVSLPTAAANPNLILVYSITNDSNLRQLTNGRRYYVWIRAVVDSGEGNEEGDASPILPVVPLSNSLFILNNQNIPGKSGDAVAFPGPGTADLADCPDTPAAGTVSLFFQLKYNAGGYSPYCTVFSNGIYIQDLGYAESIVARNSVPAWPNGYLGTDASVVLIPGHVLAAYDSADGVYAKIFIEAAPPAQGSPTANVTCSLRVMIQTIPGMTGF